MIGLYTDRPARRGASTGDAGLMEQAGCAAGEQASGPGRTKSSACAAPAGLGLVSRTLGRLRDPPWGYYGPCARSSLDGLAPMPVPGSADRSRKMPQQGADRRAGPRHGPVISGDPEIGLAARQVTGCGASAPAPVGA